MAATVDSTTVSLLPSPPDISPPTSPTCTKFPTTATTTTTTTTTTLPTIPSDEDRSSEDGSRGSASPKRADSNTSSISEPVADREVDEMEVHEERDDGPVKQRSRSSTIKSNHSYDNIRRLSATEMQRLANSPESLPVAPAPKRRSTDQDTTLARFTEQQREAIRQSMQRLPELRQNEPFQPSPVQQPSSVVPEVPNVWNTREAQRRPSPAPRTLSTPPTGRKQASETPVPFSSTRRYSFQPMTRPSPMHLNLDGVNSQPGSMTMRNGPATAIPIQPIDASSIRAPSPIPPLIPLPPMSLPTHLQLELAAQRPSPLYIHQSHTHDLPYESNAIKFERLKNVLLLPPILERTLNFGAVACLDAWLYNFTILPVRFILALTVLFRWWAYVVWKEAKWLVGFVWYGLGRLWSRARRGRPYAPSEASDGERSRSQSRTRAFSGDQAFAHGGKMARRRSSANANGGSHLKNNRSRPESGTFRHRRTKSIPSNLSAFHKADLLQGLVIICSSVALMSLDASRMYHFIRAQSAIKLYVIYNILEVGDRLLSALGQDILECLFSTETLSRNASGRSKVLLPLGMFLLALLYCCLHSIALYYQVITLNVAVNSYSNALLTLLLSNQFVEIKSTVFKRFEKDNLFQLTCADIVERFQLWIMLLIIGMRNVVEVGGLSIPGAGLSEPGFDESSGASPLHSSSILPHAFTVLPSWLMSGEVLSPFLIVIGSEMLVDTIKHAYVSKFNNIKPAFYSRILDILCKDYYTNAFMTPSLTRRLGLAVIPLSCLFIRASVQTYHMLLSTHLPMPMPASTQTSLTDPSATPSSPAVIAALNRFDALIRDSLGRATYGYPYGSPLNSRPWYAWTSDDVIAAVTMIVVFFIAFLVLLIIKLLLGMVLLKYARNRYAKMKGKEYSGKQEYEAAGKRVGGYGFVEVGEERQRWVHADPSEGLKGGKGPGGVKKAEKKEEGGDYEGVFRYEMVAKRIW